MKNKESILPAHGFLRLNQVLQLIPISKTSWYEGIKAKKYPAPLKIGKRTSVWRAGDIHQLIEELGSSQ
ncbi:MAG: AlpA family phage regulatory protein [Ghiorsea sp.]|nr:AlpA family phage regulatory protein [Ghiorsea sp.]